MFPMVNMLGINARPLCNRSLCVRRPLACRLVRRSPMLFSDHSNRTAAAANSVPDGDRHLGACWKQYIHSRPKADQSHQFAFLYRIPHPLPEYNPPRHDTGNLREDKFDAAVTDHDDIAFIFDACRMIIGCLEGSLSIVHRLNGSRDGTSVHMNIEERQKDAHFSDVTDPFDLHDLSIGRRNDHRRIRRNRPAGIPKKECHEGHQNEQDYSDHERVQPECTSRQEKQWNQKLKGIAGDHKGKEFGAGPEAGASGPDPDLGVLMAQLVSEILDQRVHLIFQM
jgi:hypothetical protein